MSVEDIDYLYENSEKDNFILYVDSAIRDRNFYPYPSKYTLTFDQPFKYVVGIDILDASIPSTMYNIETDANSFSGFTYQINSLETGTYNSTLQTLLYELQEFDEFNTSMYSTTIPSSPSVSSTENLSRVTGQVVVSTFDQAHTLYRSTNPLFTDDWRYDNIPLGNNTPYWLYRKDSYTNTNIKRREHFMSSDGPFYTFTYKGTLYAIEESNPNKDDYVEKIENFRIIIQENSDKTCNLIYYQIDNVNQSALLQLQNYSLEILYIATFTFFYSECIPGNYSATSFLDEAKRAFGGTNVTVNASSTSDVSIQPKLKFTSSFPFVLNMDNSTIRTSVGFDELAEENNPNYTKLYFRTNKRLFSSSYNSGSETWNLTAPGVLYLLGTRYCVLKCPEIESHLYASRSYGQFSPGIGIFKMYAVNDIAHQRFDFVNFHKKPFHPIGKLDKLTFSFERADGSSYDFKGANHLLLVCIRYLVPSQKRKFTRSILNPNYTYDFNAYISRQMQYKENSDTDEEVIGKSDFKNNYLKKEIAYEYATSEEDDRSSEGISASDSEVDYRTIRRV